MSAPKVLITGIAGFVGSHLAEVCLAHECEVHGVYRGTLGTNVAGLKGRLHLHRLDLLHDAQVAPLLEEIQPELVFHLAAETSVPKSWSSPALLIHNNTAAEANLLQALRGSRARVLLACSSEEYGMSALQGRLDERSPLMPLTPYGLSKMNQDLLGLQYFRAFGVQVVRTRAFNHTGPRQSCASALSDFAKQIALIERGVQEPILRVGNLQARRNFSDVRDIAAAYWLALEKGIPGEVYNVCGDECLSIAQMLDILLGFSAARIEVRTEKERMRPLDIPVFDGDSTLFRRVTGWKPRYRLEKTLEDLLNSWRAQVP